MITLSNYLKINESLDTDNLQWKIDTWFERNPEQRQAWDSLIAKVREAHGAIDNNAFDEYYANFSCVKEFVDFMTDNLVSATVYRDEFDVMNVHTIDYTDVFRTIVKYIASL